MLSTFIEKSTAILCLWYRHSLLRHSTPSTSRHRQKLCRHHYKKKKQANRKICSPVSCVPRAGVEPARVAPLVFETSASTDSAIWALHRAFRCFRTQNQSFLAARKNACKALMRCKGKEIILKNKSRRTKKHVFSFFYQRNAVLFSIYCLY